MKFTDDVKDFIAKITGKDGFLKTGMPVAETYINKKWPKNGQNTRFAQICTKFWQSAKQKIGEMQR